MKIMNLSYDRCAGEKAASELRQQAALAIRDLSTFWICDINIRHRPNGTSKWLMVSMNNQCIEYKYH